MVFHNAFDTFKFIDAIVFLLQMIRHIFDLVDEFPENLRVSEQVEKEDRGADKSVELSEEISNQKELASAEDDLNEPEMSQNHLC